MTTQPLKHVARLRYGDALPVDERDEEGSVLVYGSGGPHGRHSDANTNGPVIVVGRKGTVGALHWSEAPVWVADTAYAVDRLLRPGTLRFIYYFLRSSRLPELSQDVGVPGLAREAVHALRCPVQSEADQHQVVRFLDEEVMRLEDAIRSATATAEQLANVERDIADRVGAGSRVVPLKAVATIHSGVTLNESKTPCDGVYVPYLRVANVKAGWLDLNDVKEVAVAPADIERQRLRKGDLLLTEGGDLDKLGRGALWGEELDVCLFQNHIFAVRPDADRFDAAFLSWASRSSAARSYFEATASRITNIASTNRAKLGRWPVPDLPIAEQHRRVLEAETDWSLARRAIEKAQGMAVLLTEYRDALIDEAVSGKLDVSRASQQQMNERLHAAAEDRLDEVPA